MNNIHELRAKVEAMAPPYTPDDLKTIRESFGFKPAEFARLLRVDRSTWHKWENGQPMPAAAVALIQAVLLMRQHRTLVYWLDGC